MTPRSQVQRFEEVYAAVPQLYEMLASRADLRGKHINARLEEGAWIVDNVCETHEELELLVSAKGTECYMTHVASENEELPTEEVNEALRALVLQQLELARYTESKECQDTSES